MAGQSAEDKRSIPKETKILGEDEYVNNFNGIYTCVECSKPFLGREDSFLCMHCLNVIHGE